MSSHVRHIASPVQHISWPQHQPSQLMSHPLIPYTDNKLLLQSAVAKDCQGLALCDRGCCALYALMQPNESSAEFSKSITHGLHLRIELSVQRRHSITRPKHSPQQRHKIPRSPNEPHVGDIVLPPSHTHRGSAHARQSQTTIHQL